MSILYSGGLWTVGLILALSLGYVWALNGPRWAYKALPLVALAVIFGALCLPEHHAFRLRVVEGLIWWKWATILAFPVLLYVLGLRKIKKKVDAKHDS